MASRRVRLTYAPPQIKEPIVYLLGQRFAVVTNIRRADVRESFAWLTLELTGEESAIEQGLEWVRSQGVRVDPVSGDVVEG